MLLLLLLLWLLLVARHLPLPIISHQGFRNLSCGISFSQLLIQNPTSHLKNHKREFILESSLRDHGFKSPQIPYFSHGNSFRKVFFFFNSNRTKEIQSEALFNCTGGRSGEMNAFQVWPHKFNCQTHVKKTGCANMCLKSNHRTDWFLRLTDWPASPGETQVSEGLGSQKPVGWYPENDCLYCRLVFIYMYTHVHLHRQTYSLTYMHIQNFKKYKIHW